ncbi:MAG TPA: hypothetical protein VF177_14130 [Anaerolineae bacterium]
MKTQSLDETGDRSNLLRQSLRGNGLFSALSGLVFLFGARPLADFMGLPWPAVLVTIGLVTILYAGLLFWMTAQPAINRSFARTTIVLDASWVIASIAILLAGWPPLSVAGKWTVALLAEVVALFAILQSVGLRRLA